MESVHGLAKEFIMLRNVTKQEPLESVEFKHWSIFLDNVVLVLRDLTHLF